MTYQTFHQKKMRRGFSSKFSVFLACALPLLAMAVGLESCSSKSHSSSQSDNAKLKTQAIPFSLTYSTPLGLNLEGGGPSLHLVSTATNISVSVSGCKTGYTVSSTTITSGHVNLYNGDQSCLVKLQSFNFGSTTYSSSGQNAVSFTTWLAGDVATFQNTGSSTDLIKVFVKSQVSTSGVLSTDTVAYNFTDIQAGSADTVSQVNVSKGVPLGAVGEASPNFSIIQARYLSTNSNGSANMSFSLACGDALTGSSNPTYACDTVLLQSQLDYILITDAYSQGPITVAQANSAFAAASPTSVGSLIVAPGGSDLNSNTLANGGFYTSNASPLVTGTAAIYPDNLNNVFMLRRKDSSGNTMSYIYFYVNIASIVQYSTVSGCGTTFAGGAGTSVSPFLVVDATTLANTVNCTSSTTYFVQGNDINLGGSGSPWTPIALSGQYNGAGFTISNLYVNSSTPVTNIGLFSVINSGASVSNLTLTSASVNGGGTVGALAGLNSGTVTNCSASGSVSISGTPTGFSNSVGGLIGNVGGSVTSSSSSVTVTNSATSGNISFGGLVGFSGGTISNSFATGSVSITGLANLGATMGAFVGFLFDGSISDSYSTGNITASTSSGSQTQIGFVGSGEGTISGCYATGTYSVINNSSSVFVGGILGNNGGGTTSISNSYAMVTISVNTTGSGTNGGVGGFIGRSTQTGGTVTISSSYSASPSMSFTSYSGSKGGFQGVADASLTNCYLYANGSVPTDSSSGLTSYTTSTQMQTQGNFSGFTFGTGTDNWKMPSANPLSPASLLSPVLFWQCGSNGIVCP